MSITCYFTRQQIIQMRALDADFKILARESLLRASHTRSMSIKMVALGLEAPDRFPLITSALFKKHMPLSPSNWELVRAWMKKNSVDFASPRDAGLLWSAHMYDSCFPSLNDHFVQAAANASEGMRATGIAVRAAQRGLESSIRISRVTLAFFNAVMSPESRMPGILAERVLKLQGLTFEKQ